MSVECELLHDFINSLDRYHFRFDEKKLPNNGVYILFEKFERAHGQDRIVRIGTHTGGAKLVSRLKEHFLVENKDRSIFRKNIGRAILNTRKDPFLMHWNLDLTERNTKEKFAHLIDFHYQKSVEKEVTEYIQDNISFSVIKVNDKQERHDIEAKLIGTVSCCKNCAASSTWLGLNSPKAKIGQSGLWQVQKLYKEAYTLGEMQEFRERFIESV